MHTIRIGDTLYMLARQYQISLDALMRANPDLDPYNLRVGMQLCIPIQSSNNTAQGAPIAEIPRGEATYGYTDTKMYKTQYGDTLTRILDRYEITFAALKNSNPDVDFNGPLENMTLCIPSEDLYRTCPMSGAYIVKSGDSLDSISRKLLVLTDSLMMSNPTLTIEDFSVPGTKVCIPN